MPHSRSDTTASGAKPAELHFRNHRFGAYCYAARRCHVVYNGREQLVASEQHDAPALDPDRDPKGWEGNEIVDRSFPGPVEVSWETTNGTALNASIDLDRIFPDRRILHRVPTADMPANAFVDDPAIIVVIDGRRIDVYMRAFVPTNAEQIPGNRFSRARTDLILAWSHSY